MTYPQQPDEESSEDTQAIHRQQEQEDPVSPFGPAPDPQQAAPQPVDPFAPPSYGPPQPQPQQYQQPAQPQYQQPQQPQYPQQPPANPAEPPTVPNQWGPQQPQVYVPQNPPVYTPEQPQPPYQPPVSGPPAYTPPPVSAPPSQQVSAPPVYTPPVSGPPAYTPPVSGPPAYTPPPVSAPPSGQVSGPPAFSQQPVSSPPNQQVSGPPVYVPPVSAPPAHQQYPSGPDPQVFAPKPVVPDGPTFTGTQPDPALWGGAPVPGPKKGIPKAVVIVSVIIVVVALGIGAVLFFNTGGGTPSADPSANSSQDPQASGPPVIALNPVTNEQTRLEYLTPGDWTALTTAPAAFNELAQAVGELKEGASFPALFLNGGLDTALIPYAGPAQIGVAAADLATTLDGGRYVGTDGNPLKGLKREAAPTVQQARIDGRVAVILRYHMIWDDPAKAAGGDTVTVALIDIDGSRAAAVYTAVPDDMPDLVKSAEDRLMTLHFNM
ncbi:hypothetical protein [Phytomonospora endophytica]|uniref:Uncharacterized protein n=1 Tax=Phytomonospora endophytica TaxID=714109 RepID=A0A841FQ54_9ACTN|nr:hypothetical protein [Phytomonospora endophytica]MBB6034689.1 hypothetical protein [Phytomonospora endophytica]GIG69110.1 hypothetical protein Pen01_54050 [Phytomonospora endophytica]